MICITDINGRQHLLHKDSIHRISQPGDAAAWHGVRAFVRLANGNVIESRQSPDEIAAQMVVVSPADYDALAQRCRDWELDHALLRDELENERMAVAAFRTGYDNLRAELEQLRGTTGSAATAPHLNAAEQPDTVAVPRELLGEAESIIDSYAEALRASCAPGGDWDGAEAALDDYEREAGVAAKLRALLAGGAE